jgi:hypothetical protein
MMLRAPWYVCKRGGFDRFDPRSFAPAIQKYDFPEYVDLLVRDPSDSLVFDEKADVWSFPLPRGENDPKPTKLRDLLSPFVLVRSDIRKLYQPSHQRFYAVAVELFCDTAGLPRPGEADTAAVTFVLRRLRTTFAAKDPVDIKDLARAAANTFFRAKFPPKPTKAQPTDPELKDVYPPNDPTREAAEDLASLYRLQGDDLAKHAAFETSNAELIGRVGMKQELQGWVVDAAGRGSWTTLPTEPGGDPLPVDGEQELPMWRLPATAAGCAPARDRSLWFGAVPTYSGELGDDGRPKLDDRATYVLQCVARRPQPPPREACPRLVKISGRTEPYRLAAFFDPGGTANRRIHVRLPDFAALAARAGDAASGGGVEFERPAGSQLPPGPRGKIPDPASGFPGGDSAETCSYAIELITIVASFVLALFLPVVVFAFQLWWMLLLKFCWPKSADAEALLSALNTHPIDGLVDPDRRRFLEMLGVTDDVIGDLFRPDATTVKQDKDLGKKFVEALQPDKPPADATIPLPPVTDPLCRLPGGPLWDDCKRVDFGSVS